MAKLLDGGMIAVARPGRRRVRVERVLDDAGDHDPSSVDRPDPRSGTFRPGPNEGQRPDVASCRSCEKSWWTEAPMQALLAFSVHDATMLVRAADVACALSVEALLGTDRPYDERVQVIRPHPGQLVSAANLRGLLAGSPLLASHRHSRHAVQDAYCLRCAPQVHGAVRDVLTFACQILTTELGAVVDNPVIVPDGEVMTTGNFHGEPLAFAADMLAMALAELASISERRVDRMLDPAFSRGLPP
ncbi:MAG: aromatic amino acid lyase, partial [Streptosporangiaceae bacterium]